MLVFVVSFTKKFYLSCQFHAIDFLSDVRSYEAYDVQTYDV